jgi:hypothetical protein
VKTEGKVWPINEAIDFLFLGFPGDRYDWWMHCVRELRNEEKWGPREQEVFSVRMKEHLTSHMRRRIIFYARGGQRLIKYSK